MTNNRKVIVQLTIDSTESIEKVLLAVGGLYGVDVQVASGSTEVTGSRPGKAQPASRRRNAAKTAPARRKSGSRSRAGKSDSSSAVREWAKANGYEVADRGRISAAIRDAYRVA